MSVEKLELQCPSCHRRFRGPVRLAGHKVKCPLCAASISVPPLAAPAFAAPAGHIPPEADVPQSTIGSQTDAGSCEPSVEYDPSGHAPASAPPVPMPAAPYTPAPAVSAARAKPLNPTPYLIGIGAVAVVALLLIIFGSRLFGGVDPKQLVGTWTLSSSPSKHQLEGVMVLTFDDNPRVFTLMAPGRQAIQGSWEVKGWRLKLDAQGQDPEAVIDSLDSKTLQIKTKEGLEIWTR